MKKIILFARGCQLREALGQRGSFDKTDICLQNNDFIKLKNEAQKIGVTIGGDFLIYSATKTIKNEILETLIPLH
ncbi:hypothetical protein FACS1894156_8320 [Bacteroidia bacterium]|nr:hypothetical protein FACS1894156_8320 [Bacteroidia bacterium]